MKLTVCAHETQNGSREAGRLSAIANLGSPECYVVEHHPPATMLIYVYSANQGHITTEKYLCSIHEMLETLGTQYSKRVIQIEVAPTTPVTAEA
jgi:hypothetical protein